MELSAVDENVMRIPLGWLQADRQRQASPVSQGIVWPREIQSCRRPKRPIQQLHHAGLSQGCTRRAFQRDQQRLSSCRHWAVGNIRHAHAAARSHGRLARGGLRCHYIKEPKKRLHKSSTSDELEGSYDVRREESSKFRFADIRPDRKPILKLDVRFEPAI
jgi:hypothetical protein